MQIALWSNETGGNGTTTTASALATTLAASYNYRTLITHCLSFDRSMENYMMKTKERSTFEGIGESNTEGLFRLLKNGKLSKDMVKDYCFSLLSHSNLDFLYSFNGYELNDDFVVNYTYLCYLARQFYDITIVDLEIGCEHPLCMKVLKDTDILIVVCPNNRYRIEQLIKTTEALREEIEQKGTKIIYCVNQVQGSKELYKKQFRGIQVPLFIPYEASLIDPCDRGELVDYILRRCYSQKNDSIKEYMTSMQQLIQRILRIYEGESRHVI